MAHGAFGFEITRAIATRSRAKNKHRGNSRKNYLRYAYSNKRLHFAIPPFLGDTISCVAI
jgi:hypothetical protein